MQIAITGLQKTQKHGIRYTEILAAFTAYHQCVYFTSKHIYRHVCWRGLHRRCERDGENKRQTGQWGIHWALIPFLIPSEHSRKGSGRRCRSTKLWKFSSKCPRKLRIFKIYCASLLKIQPGTILNSETSAII